MARGAAIRSGLPGRLSSDSDSRARRRFFSGVTNPLVEQAAMPLPGLRGLSAYKLAAVL